MNLSVIPRIINNYSSLVFQNRDLFAIISELNVQLLTRKSWWKTRHWNIGNFFNIRWKSEKTSFNFIFYLLSSNCSKSLVLWVNRLKTFRNLFKTFEKFLSFVRHILLWLLNIERNYLKWFAFLLDVYSSEFFSFCFWFSDSNYLTA